MRKPVLICAAILMFLAGCRVAPETHIGKIRDTGKTEE